MGKYDKLDEERSNNGEVSHFQALATAVSGTVGNGNIAGLQWLLHWEVLEQHFG